MKLIAASVVAGALAGEHSLRGQTKSLAKMQPEQVSKLLSDVEHDWVSHALLSMDKANTKYGPKEAKSEMVDSCSTVVASIVEASEGEKDRVVEYMQDVCNVSHEPANCKVFGDAVLGELLSYCLLLFVSALLG